MQEWVLTWSVAEAQPRERREFDDEKSAVVFVMEQLKEDQRWDAELLALGAPLPIGFFEMEQIYANYPRVRH